MTHTATLYLPTKHHSIYVDDAYGDDWTYHGGQNQTVNLATGPAKASDIALTSLRFMGPRSYITPQQFLFVPPSFQIINGVGVLTNGSTTLTLSNSGFTGWTGDFIDNDDWSYQDFWTSTTGTKYVSDGVLLIGSTQYGSFGLPMTLPYGTTQSFFMQRELRGNDILLQKTFSGCCVPGKVYYVTFWAALSSYWNKPSTLKAFLDPGPTRSGGSGSGGSSGASIYGQLLITMNFDVTSLTPGSGWVQLRSNAFTATSNDFTLIFAMTPDTRVSAVKTQAVAVTDIMVVGSTPVPATQTFDAIRTLMQPQTVDVDYLVNNVLYAGVPKFTSSFTVCDAVTGITTSCTVSPSVFNNWNTGWTFVGAVSIESHATFTTNVNQMPYDYQGRISTIFLINPYPSYKSLHYYSTFTNLIFLPNYLSFPSQFVRTVSANPVLDANHFQCLTWGIVLFILLYVE